MDLRTAKSLSPREYHAHLAASRRARRECGPPSAKPSRTLSKKPTVEDCLVLDRRIRKGLEILERLWEELEAVDLGAPEIDERDIVFTGYNRIGWTWSQ